MKKALTLALALSIGAASAQSAFVWPAAWTAEQNTANKRGGEYRQSTISDFKTFNPFTSAESGSIPTQMSSGTGLFTQDPRNDEFIPYMAAGMPTVSNDGKRFVVKIRQGMKFSDGQAVTADDWISTHKIETDDKVGSNAYDGWFINDKMITVKKLDNYTLQFDFPQRSATAFVTMSYTPWPDHIFGAAYRRGGADAIKAMWTLATPPAQTVTAGMWMLDTYRAGERVVFKKNPNWGDWNKDSRGQELPYLNNMSIRIVADANAALAAFLAGQIDTVGMRNADDLAQTKKAIDSGSLKAFLKANVSPQATSQWIVFNWNKASEPAKQKLFRDVRFRRAMSHIANRKAMVDLALGGLGSETYFSAYPIFKQQVDAALALGAPRYQYNLAEATRLLAQIGYKKKNAQGYLVDSAGKVLEFTLSTNAGNTTREQLGRIFADEAKKVGVKVNFTPIDFNALVGQLTAKGENRPFDAILLGLSGGDNIWPFGSNVVPCGGNLHSYNNPTNGACLTSQEQLMTKLFYQGDGEVDTAKRRAIGAQLLKIEGELQPVIYLVGGNFHVAFNERVGGEFPANLMDAYYGTRVQALTFIK